MSMTFSGVFIVNFEHILRLFIEPEYRNGERNARNAGSVRKDSGNVQKDSGESKLRFIS